MSGVSFHSVLWVWPSLYIPCVPGRSGPLVIAAMLHQIWLAWQILLSMPTILYPIGPEAWRGWQRILLYGRTYNITLALSYYTLLAFFPMLNWSVGTLLYTGVLLSKHTRRVTLSVYHACSVSTTST